MSPIRKLALVCLITGCCQSPPATPDTSIDVPPVHRQSQSTITVHDGPHSQSVRIQSDGGGDIKSRVTVGSDGKLIVEEITVGPVRR